jgi:hypothetical protein
MAQRGIEAKIDLIELEKLSQLQCTDEEIAAWFGVTVRTIERKRKNPKFAAVMQRGRGKGRISVRRMQMKLLEQGNATMGVWLGKQLLGQTDHLYHEVNGPLVSMVIPVQVGTTNPDEFENCAAIRPRQLSAGSEPVE